MLSELRIAGILTVVLAGGVIGNQQILQNKTSQANEVEQVTEEEATSVESDTETARKDIKILGVGDIMLGRYVETLMNNHGDTYPFEKLGELINDQDIVFANFEGPIVTNHVQTPDFTTSFDFHPRMAQVLADQGFNLVSLANNHTLDKGVENFEQTIVYLEEAGIQSIGHSREESLNYSYETEIEGQNFYFLGFNEAVNPVFNLENAIAATETASEDPNTFVVVSVHWGIEYQLQSASFQQDIAHQLIDAGADLIIGHHPHVTQEIEVYKDRMIFYSLGNFIFDQYFSVDTQEELGFEMTLDANDNLSYELIPIQSVRSQASPMAEEEKLNWLSSFATRVQNNPSLQKEVQEGVVNLKWNKD